MAALALPLAFVILRRVMATRAWRALAAPVVLGAAILALGPLWNQQTLGDWRLDPYPHYSRVYFPFDKPGFGADPTPPLRPLVPEIAAVGEWSRDLHARYTLSSVPSAFAERLIAILVWCADGWRLALGALIVAAVLHASGVERAGVATIALLLLAYLTFAHPPMWIALLRGGAADLLFPRGTRAGPRAPQVQRPRVRSQRSAGRRRWPTRRWRSRSCCCRSA